jgi:hypothetical protein
MSTTIITRHSTVATVAPSAGQLVLGELAVNVTDKKLYTLDASNNVVLLAAGGVSPVDPFSITVNSASPALTLTNNGSGSSLYIAAGDMNLATTRQIQWGLITSSQNAFISGAEGAASFVRLGTLDVERLRITANGGVSFGSTGTAYGTSGQSLVSAGDSAPVWTDQITSITFVFSGAGSPILSGYAGDLQIPFGCTITEAALVADQSGSIVLGISKSSYAGFPGSLTSIVASAPPTLSSQQKSVNSTLTGWTTSVTANDVLRFSVTSAAAVTNVTLTLKVKRT